MHKLFLKKILYILINKIRSLKGGGESHQENKNYLESQTF